MSGRQVKCPTCGATVMGEWEGEENLVSVKSNDIYCPPGRNFRATCPVHGGFIHQDLTGHHSDLRIGIRREFKGKLDVMKSRLRDDELERFVRAYDGHYLPTEAELKHWKKLRDDSEN